MFNFSGPASKLILKLCFAVWCGITGALFVFPGLRVSRMHWDALRYLLFHLNLYLITANFKILCLTGIVMRDRC